MSDIVKQEFAVDGMSCQGCVRGVTGALSKVTGVKSVEVSLEKAGATVEFDPASVQPAAIVAAIEAAGFDARPR
jgi:copper chaperone